MRKIRELLSVNDKGMSIVMLVVITILLPNTILRGLGAPMARGAKCCACTKHFALLFSDRAPARQ